MICRECGSEILTGGCSNWQCPTKVQAYTITGNGHGQTIEMQPSEPPAPSGMCAKCGERHATQAILTMVERPGATLFYCDECAAPPIAPAPQWSTEPPTEPGWYWMRGDGDAVADPAHTCFDDEGKQYWWTFAGLMIYGVPVAREWWPIPISEPPR